MTKHRDLDLENNLRQQGLPRRVGCRYGPSVSGRAFHPRLLEEKVQKQFFEI